VRLRAARKEKDGDARCVMRVRGWLSGICGGPTEACRSLRRWLWIHRRMIVFVIVVINGTVYKVKSYFLIKIYKKNFE
jgi:hypothetical protein